MTPQDGGPAFPATVYDKAQHLWYEVPGMSLRDWFAGQALAGLAACPTTSLNNGMRGKNTSTGHAALAYEMADAMLAKQAKGGAA